MAIGRPSAEAEVLLECGRHGDEPAGREACLSTVRDLSCAATRATRRFLERTTVLVVPTANLDGRAAGTRGNGDGVHIVRDRLALRTAGPVPWQRSSATGSPTSSTTSTSTAPDPRYYDKDVYDCWPRDLDTRTPVHDEAGPAGTGLDDLGGADDDPADASEVLRDPPRGYRLTADQYADVGDELAPHGVQVRPTGEEGAYVPLRQSQRALVPPLPDERATYRLAVGEPDTRC
ncbi:hypothetical protein STENM223S_10891 [Streptomyces tendae]